MSSPDNEDALPAATALIQWILRAGCLLFACYHVYTTIFGMPVAYVHRPVHVLFAVALGFLIYPGNKKRGVAPLDIILSLLAIGVFITPVLQADMIAERMVMVDELSPWQLFSGGAAIVLAMLLVQRVIGTALTVVCTLFLGYAFAGPYLPGALAHKGFIWSEIVDYISYGLEGLYSSAIGVSSTYIAAFIIFGTFLELCGAGEVMMDLGRALTGGYRGGPAKIAVITSAFFGSISGSAAANVYATGTFTIPLMKKCGYKADFAGAVEAAASTGGQLMPPVMGAAAFLMADILGVPYIEICKAAVIPSILYFFSIIMMVDFEAAKLGLAGVPRDQLPRLREVSKRLYLLAPIAVLVIAMMWYTPFRAAIVASASAVLVSWFDKRSRLGPRRILEALAMSGRRMVLIAVACLGAGIVIGVVTLTGVGLNMASIVISVSGGYSLLALVLIMISSIIMGMGTPTTVAYIVVATRGVPALLQLGFPVLSAHFFVFYFGVVSMVTPPVAVAAYAGAEVAGGNMMRTAMIATRLCFVAFLVPFLFMYEPALLMVGSAGHVLQAFVTACIGTVALAGALEGWYMRMLTLPLRLILFIAAITLIIPGLLTDLIGLALFVSVTVFCRMSKKPMQPNSIEAV